MLAIPLLALSVLSQGLVSRFGPPPDLTPGQKVKVRIAEPARLQPLMIVPPGIRPVTVVGTVTGYRPLELITVRREGWIAGIGPTTERTVDWIDVMGIEVPQQRNGVNAVQGAASGFGAALGWGLMAGFFDGFFCTRGARCDRNAWHHTKRAAVYTVPVGAVIGFFSTRWKRVY